MILNNTLRLCLVCTGLNLIAILLTCHFLNKSMSSYNSLVSEDLSMDSTNSVESEYLSEILVSKHDSINFLINANDIEKLNNHIKNLAIISDKNYDNSVHIIDNEIDRLNLYMAIGIGFLGLIGFLFPIAINFISTSELKEKITDSKLRITKIETEVNAKLPQVETLILQNAIGRFLNVSPHIISTQMAANEKIHFIQILSKIKAAFEACKKLNKIPSNEEYLMESIRDLRFFILKWKYVTSSFGKNVLKLFEDLAKDLEALENNMDPSSTNNAYVKVISTFQKLIESLNR